MRGVNPDSLPWINGSNLIGTGNTEYGIVTDNTAVMVAAKVKPTARCAAKVEDVARRLADPTPDIQRTRGDGCFRVDLRRLGLLWREAASSSMEAVR